MRADFDTLTPEARRLVLIANDDVYAKLVSQIDWPEIAKSMFPLSTVVSAPMGLVFGTALASSSYAAPTFNAFIGDFPETLSARLLWSKRLETKEIPIPHLAVDEAVRRFQFEPGKPIEGGVYALDPFDNGRYLWPAKANDQLTKNRYAMFLKIADFLGAKKIMLHSVDLIRLHDDKIDVGLAKSIATSVGINAKFDNESILQPGEVASFEYSGMGKALMHEHKPWVMADQGMHGMVTARLNHSATTAKVSLRLEDSIDIGQNAIAEMTERKFTVGGPYCKVHPSIWHFTVEFYPRDDD